MLLTNKKNTVKVFTDNMKKSIKWPWFIVIICFVSGPPAGASPSGAPQYKGEMPADDVDDNPNLADLQPTAPPVDKMDSIEGYGSIGFNAGMMC